MFQIVLFRYEQPVSLRKKLLESQEKDSHVYVNVDRHADQDELAYSEVRPFSKEHWPTNNIPLTSCPAYIPVKAGEDTDSLSEGEYI